MSKKLLAAAALAGMMALNTSAIADTHDDGYVTKHEMRGVIKEFCDVGLAPRFGWVSDECEGWTEAIFDSVQQGAAAAVKTCRDDGGTNQDCRVARDAHYLANYKLWHFRLGLVS